LSSTFSISCPKSNADPKMFPLVTTASVLCKACGGTLKAVDMDSKAGNYMVELKWGGLMQNTAKSTFFTGFDSWRILLVDDYGVMKADLGKVGVKSGAAPTCCDPSENSRTVMGTWPKGATKFMVVPYANAIAAGESKHGEFWLPMGVMSNKFVDKTTGAGKKHTGNLVLQMDDPEKFVKSDHAVQIMTTSITKAIPGAKEEMVYICPECITLGVASRRLSDSERRLVGKTVNVKYVLLVPADSKVAFKGASSISADTLKTAMTVEAKKAGMKNFKVHSAVVKKVTTTDNNGASTTGGESTVTGGASPVAGFSALIVMLAGCQFFA